VWSDRCSHCHFCLAQQPTQKIRWNFLVPKPVLLRMRISIQWYYTYSYCRPISKTSIHTCWFEIDGLLRCTYKIIVARNVMERCCRLHQLPIDRWQRNSCRVATIALPSSPSSPSQQKSSIEMLLTPAWQRVQRVLMGRSLLMQILTCLPGSLSEYAKVPIMGTLKMGNLKSHS